MSQLGSNGPPVTGSRPPDGRGPGTFECVAGFRIGRGRDNRTPQQQQAQAPRAPGPYQGTPPYGGQQPAPWPPASGGPQPYQQPRNQGGYGEPEYFGDPHHHAPQGHDPYAANNPGHTQAFSVRDDDVYGDGATYRAGSAPAAPSGPRLHWKQLLSGIVLRPGPTFFQMRDYPVWGPALAVTFLYGLLAIFGLDEPRDEVISATLSNAVPAVLMAGVVFVVSGLLLGAVTHTLARQFGGTGSWQPTVGLSMLVMCISDTPRLVFAVFLGGENSLVQVLGWATWVAAGALFTSMVSKSHDLPWPKALGASAIQLIALLSIIKLGTV